MEVSALKNKGEKMNLDNHVNYINKFDVKNNRSGIYALHCKENGKTYIGRSVKINSRRHKHLKELSTNRHANTHLQRAWNLYGKRSFIFTPILFCDRVDLNMYEGLVATLFKGSLFNLGAIGNYVEMSLETRHKASLARKGKKHSEKHCQNMSKARKGKPGHAHSEESKEKLRKANKARGENSGMSVLTNEQVFHIKKEYMTGIRVKELGVKYGVKAKTISAIILGKNWKHIPFPEGFQRRPKEKLTKEQIPLIRERFKALGKYAQIAKEFGVDRQTIADIIQGTTWKNN